MSSDAAAVLLFSPYFLYLFILTSFFGVIDVTTSLFDRRTCMNKRVDLNYGILANKRSSKISANLNEIFLARNSFELIKHVRQYLSITLSIFSPAPLIFLLYAIPSSLNQIELDSRLKFEDIAI